MKKRIAQEGRSSFLRRANRLSVCVCMGLALAALVRFAGCATPAVSGNFAGVTTGGAQDWASARSIIEGGDIPDVDAIVVEGFLSEHSIPIAQPDDAGELFVTASTAWNADYETFLPLSTVSVGFGTNIDRETFQRDPLNLAIVVDRSGSMDDRIDSRTGFSKWDAVQVAIDRMLAQLNENDLVSVVTFNQTPETRVDGAAGDDLATIKGSLDGIAPDGGTDLLLGMVRGYSLVQRNEKEGLSNRIMVFTDALPTGRLSADSPTEFLQNMRSFAVAPTNIGTTVFGVGADFGQELSYDISQVRGGNFFFIDDYERLVQIMDEEFRFLVSPVAYDVAMDVEVPFELDPVDYFGLPGGQDESLSHTLKLDIPTLFLSNREGGGAILVRLRAGASLDATQANTIADISLSYTDRDGEQHSDAATASIPANVINGEDRWFENDGAQRACLLLNTALVMQKSIEDVGPEWDGYGYYYWDRYPGDSDVSGAIDRLTSFLDYFDAMAADLDDSASETSRKLSQERELIVTLRSVIDTTLPRRFSE